MRILLWAEFQKLRRSNIIFFTVFATILVAVIVFVSGKTTVYDNKFTTNTAGWYMTIAQVWATMLVIPAVIALLSKNKLEVSWCYCFAVFFQLLY